MWYDTYQINIFRRIPIGWKLICQKIFHTHCANIFTVLGRCDYWRSSINDSKLVFLASFKIIRQCEGVFVYNIVKLCKFCILYIWFRSTRIVPIWRFTKFYKCYRIDYCITFLSVSNTIVNILWPITRNRQHYIFKKKNTYLIKFNVL